MRQWCSERDFFRRGIVVLLAAALLLSAQAYPMARAAVELPPIGITARAALLIDAGSEEILYKRNIYDKAYPASLTKIMTALLALEFADAEPDGLDLLVTASETALEGLDPAGSTANIQAGETMTLRDLLYCTLLVSANEACNVIAEAVAGDIAAFVQKMNDRAQALGCEGTWFANAHGLHDDDHFTTAYDTYLITKEALRHPAFMEICNTASYQTPPTNKAPNGHVLRTTNNLISNFKTSDYIYYLAKGIKTGNTEMAGHCLVSSAEKSGLILLSVVMGAGNDPETNKDLSYLETKELFEWGFDNFTTKTLLDGTEQITQVKVYQGKDKDEVTLVPDLSGLPNRKLEALVPNELDVAADVRRTWTVYAQGGVDAPVSRGQVLGELTLNYTEHKVTVPLVASFGVERDETEHLVSTVKDFFAQDWVKYSLAGLAALVVIYIAFIILYNRRRRRRSARRSNYRGSRRRRGRF